jgi:hypothetical protein
MANLSYADLDDGNTAALYGDLQSFGESDILLGQRVKEVLVLVLIGRNR